jgi:hypothetical protein
LLIGILQGAIRVENLALGDHTKGPGFVIILPTAE